MSVRNKIGPLKFEWKIIRRDFHISKDLYSRRGIEYPKKIHQIQ